jgi:hypothetical protein
MLCPCQCATKMASSRMCSADEYARGLEPSHGRCHPKSAAARGTAHGPERGEVGLSASSAARARAPVFSWMLSRSIGCAG